MPLVYLSGDFLHLLFVVLEGPCVKRCILQLVEFYQREEVDCSHLLAEALLILQVEHLVCLVQRNRVV